MPRVNIKHTCGHVLEHAAWGKRVEWLKTVPCPTCAGVRDRDGVPAKPKNAPAFVLPAGAVKEYRFSKLRRFRFDYAWPSKFVALEIEGGVFIAGRHVSKSGVKRDMDKYNLAAELGWLVFRATPDNATVVVEQVSRLISNLRILPPAQTPLIPPKPLPLRKAIKGGQPARVTYSPPPGLTSLDATHVRSQAGDSA